MTDLPAWPRPGKTSQLPDELEGGRLAVEVGALEQLPPALVGGRLGVDVGGATFTAETLNVVDTPANVTPLPAVSGAIAAGATKLFGVTARETTGDAAAVVRLRDGAAAGTILATISLDYGESVREEIGPLAVTDPAGVYVELVSGTVEGSVYTL